VIAAAPTTDQRTVELPLVPVPAEARADYLDELGIVDFIASGSSSFAGSSEARAENVRVAAGHVSYALVRPGENLSFNDAVGPISLENGYVEGKIIQGDWTASDLGGGVCQVSTTVFRAAFFAGFRFEEWYPHSWRLAFYEADGSPPGLDAAIYQPNSAEEWEKDLIITNPFDTWLLLQMIIDGDTVTAQLFGATSPYAVEVGTPEIGPPVDPEPPVTREKPELPRGTRNKVQNAEPGYTVKVSRRVLDGGTVVSDGVFESVYRPQPEVWEVGPGTPDVPTVPGAVPTEVAAPEG
jgi:vancomycin resistance protein YoaR